MQIELGKVYENKLKQRYLIIYMYKEGFFGYNLNEIDGNYFYANGIYNTGPIGICKTGPIDENLIKLSSDQRPYRI